MAQATQAISTKVKVRFPVEMLQGIEEWAAARDMSRSKAIRVLLFKGLATDWSDWKCTCDGTDQCTGECDSR